VVDRSSGALPGAVIAGAVVSALLLAAAAVGAIFLFRRRRRRRDPISGSADLPGDADFVNSTLCETLVIFSDTATVEGVRPDAIVTLPGDRDGRISLM
jgi:hypothetical protein